MKKCTKFFGFVIGMWMLCAGSVVYAEDAATWVANGAAEVSAPPAVNTASSPSAQAVDSKALKLIKFKIERAISNLNGMRDDLNGRRAEVIELLQKALKELS